MFAMSSYHAIYLLNDYSHDAIFANLSTAYLDSKTLLNASVTYTDGDDRFFVRAYGKNLSDERYRVASQSVATLWTHSQWGAPRTYGIEFGINFSGE